MWNSVGQSVVRSDLPCRTQLHCGPPSPLRQQGSAHAAHPMVRTHELISLTRHDRPAPAYACHDCLTWTAKLNSDFTDSWANSACPAHFARACSHSYSPSAQIRPSILAPRPSIANMPLAGSGLPPCGAMAQSSPGGRCRHTRPRMAARATSSEPNSPLRQTVSSAVFPNVRLLAFAIHPNGHVQTVTTYNVFSVPTRCLRVPFASH